MLAVKLRGEVTGDGHLVVERTEGLEPGPVEVIILQVATTAAKHCRRPAEEEHPAFGIWSDYGDVQDPGAFAAGLRQRLERRADSRD